MFGGCADVLFVLVFCLRVRSACHMPADRNRPRWVRYDLMSAQPPQVRQPFPGSSSTLARSRRGRHRGPDSANMRPTFPRFGQGVWSNSGPEVGPHLASWLGSVRMGQHPATCMPSSTELCPKWQSMDTAPIRMFPKARRAAPVLRHLQTDGGS